MPEKPAAENGRGSDAFRRPSTASGFPRTVIGLLGVAAGLLMVSRPLIGLVTMTMLLAVYFLVDGLSEIIAAFKIKPDRGWGWVLFNGIIAVLLGLMIWRQWPVSGAWAIGVLVGIHILMTGWSVIIFGTGARSVAACHSEQGRPASLEESGWVGIPNSDVVPVTTSVGQCGHIHQRRDQYARS
jgi:hypothetical protein